SIEAQRNADAFLRRLENNKGRVLAASKLPDELIVHDDFGNASIGETAHETGATNIRAVDFQTENGRQQDAERSEHSHQTAFLIGRLQHDNGETDIGPILGGDALNQGTLFALRAGRRVAADLPFAECRFDHALSVNDDEDADDLAYACRCPD